MSGELIIGIVIVIVLAVLLWTPYLTAEIRNGKREFGPLRRLRRGGVSLGPTSPSGTGDVNPGRRGDPAPGQPDAQPDPYGPRAQRDGPRIKS